MESIINDSGSANKIEYSTEPLQPVSTSEALKSKTGTDSFQDSDKLVL